MFFADKSETRPVGCLLSMQTKVRGWFGGYTPETLPGYGV
jgi:hypothetical protein